MANKKLTISSPDAISDSTKDSILKAANVSHGAAKIVRDANQKVVEVIIHLPESASEAAAAAITATPGVSNVEITDLPEGTQGLDGTEASLLNLIASGFIQQDYASKPIITYNLDNTMTYFHSGWSSATWWYGYGKCPSAPLQLEAEFKIRVPHGSQNTFIEFANNSYAAHIGIAGGSEPQQYIEISELYISSDLVYINKDDLFHTCKFTCSPSGLLTVYYDEAEVFSRQLRYQPEFGNFINFAVSSEADREIILDYIRWTKRP